MRAPRDARRLRVVVVQGGPSSEAEVSRVSARAVADALKSAGHDVVRMELDGFLAESVRSGGYDVVFPAVHGAVGEDGSLQGLLEVLEVPYVGSGVLASALAMEKPMARRLFAAAGLPIARGVVFPREGSAAAAVAQAREAIGARFVVKPSAAGSAVGVARVDESVSDEAAAAAFEAAWAAGGTALVEHFARGREVTCGVVDALALPGPEGGAWALPPTEITAPKDAFYTFEARYAPGRSVHTCPAELGEALSQRVQAVALAAHAALGCRDLSRVDFVVGDDGDPAALTLLEVNTLPGFTGTSLYPEAAAVAGLSFATLCDGLVRSAWARGTPVRVAPRPMP